MEEQSFITSGERLVGAVADGQEAFHMRVRAEWDRQQRDYPLLARELLNGVAMSKTGAFGQMVGAEGESGGKPPHADPPCSDDGGPAVSRGVAPDPVAEMERLR